MTKGTNSVPVVPVVSDVPVVPSISFEGIGNILSGIIDPLQEQRTMVQENLDRMATSPDCASAILSAKELTSADSVYLEGLIKVLQSKGYRAIGKDGAHLNNAESILLFVGKLPAPYTNRLIVPIVPIDNGTIVATNDDVPTRITKNTSDVALLTLLQRAMAHKEYPLWSKVADTCVARTATSDDSVWSVKVQIGSATRTYAGHLKAIKPEGKGKPIADSVWKVAQDLLSVINKTMQDRGMISK